MNMRCDLSSQKSAKDSCLQMTTVLRNISHRVLYNLVEFEEKVQKCKP